MKIWVVGSPRSGTTFLTQYIGKSVDHCFDEPWEKYPPSDFYNWTFPEGDMVFKYCHNIFHYEEISRIWPDSKWIYIARNPLHVMYSMIFPKITVPLREWVEFGQSFDARFEQAFKKWRLFTQAYAKMDHLALTVRYENIDTKAIADFLELEMDSDLGFKNANLDYDRKRMGMIVDKLKTTGRMGLVSKNLPLH